MTYTPNVALNQRFDDAPLAERPRPKVGCPPSVSKRVPAKKRSFPMFATFMAVSLSMVWGSSVAGAARIDDVAQEPTALAMQTETTSQLPPMALSEKDKNIIRLQEGSGTIVGQFARISNDPDHISQLRQLEDKKEDNKKLLSIVSKY